MTSPLLEAFAEARNHEFRVNRKGDMPGTVILNQYARSIGAVGLGVALEGEGMGLARVLSGGFLISDSIFYNTTAGDLLSFEALLEEGHPETPYIVGALTCSYEDETIIWTPVNKCKAFALYSELPDGHLVSSIIDHLFQDELDTKELVRLCALTGSLHHEELVYLQAMLKQCGHPAQFWSAIYPKRMHIPGHRKLYTGLQRVEVSPADHLVLLPARGPSLDSVRQVTTNHLALCRRQSHKNDKDIIYFIDPDMPFERSISTC